MDSREYLLSLFELAGVELGVPFAEQTPAQLQTWAEEKTEGRFIALIGETSTEGDTKYLIDYTFIFTVVWDIVYDPNEDEKRASKIAAKKLANNFKFFVDASPRLEIKDWDANTTFRDGTYLGTGVGLTMTIAILDTSGYCDINTSRIETLLD